MMWETKSDNMHWDHSRRHAHQVEQPLSEPQPKTALKILSFSVEGFSAERADVLSGMNTDTICLQEAHREPTASSMPGMPIAANMDNNTYDMWQKTGEKHCSMKHWTTRDAVLFYLAQHSLHSSLHFVGFHFTLRMCFFHIPLKFPLGQRLLWPHVKKTVSLPPFPLFWDTPSNPAIKNRSEGCLQHLAQELCPCLLSHWHRLLWRQGLP